MRKTDKLGKLRKKIDAIDRKLAENLKKRQETVRQIKKVKSETKLPNVDPAREQEIFDRLENDYQKEIFKTIIDLSRKLPPAP